MSRPSKAALIGLVTVVVALAALLYVRKRFAIPTDKLEPVSGANREPQWPPGEPAPIKFALHRQLLDLLVHMAILSLQGIPSDSRSK